MEDYHDEKALQGNPDRNPSRSETALTSLTMDVQQLLSQVDSLEGRLRPVLTPETKDRPNETSVAVLREATSDLVERIESNSGLIRQASGRLETLRARLEV